MKKSQQAPPQASCAPMAPDEEPRQQRPLQSTAAILARGVSLDQVQKAVKQLRPQVHQVG